VAVGDAPPPRRGAGHRDDLPLSSGFGAIAAYAGNIRAVPGEGFGAYAANAGVEIGTEAGIGALRGGFTALANGGDFGEGAAGGAAFGAGFGAAKVALLGAKFDPKYSDDELKAEFIKQSLRDQSGLNLPPPNPSSVTFRIGGLLPLGLGRSVTLLDSSNMHPSQWRDIQHLAHELRHVGQLRALGITPFYARYLYQAATRLDQFYQPGNKTLEPEYVRY
jgi:hypothetical protein